MTDWHAVLATHLGIDEVSAEAGVLRLLIQLGVQVTGARAEQIENIEDEEDRKRASEWLELDRATLSTLKEIGFQLVPIDLPSDLPVSALSFILTAEAATA